MMSIKSNSKLFEWYKILEVRSNNQDCYTQNKECCHSRVFVEFEDSAMVFMCLERELESPYLGIRYCVPEGKFLLCLFLLCFLHQLL